MPSPASISIASIFEHVSINKLKFCWICLRTENERKLVEPTNLNRCLEVMGVQVPEEGSICYICEWESKRAYTLIQAINFAFIINRWYKDVAFRVRSKDDWPVYLDRYISRQSGARAAGPEWWVRARGRGDIVQTEILVVSDADASEHTQEILVPAVLSPMKHTSTAPAPPPPPTPSQSSVIVIDDDDPIETPPRPSPPPLKPAPQIPLVSRHKAPAYKPIAPKPAAITPQPSATAPQTIPPVLPPLAPIMLACPAPQTLKPASNLPTILEQLLESPNANQNAVSIIPIQPQSINNNLTKTKEVSGYVIHPLILGPDGNYRFMLDNVIEDIEKPIENQTQMDQPEIKKETNILEELDPYDTSVNSDNYDMTVSEAVTVGDMSDSELVRASEKKTEEKRGHVAKRPVMSGRIDWEDKIPMDIISFVDASDPLISCTPKRRKRLKSADDVIDLC